MLRSLIFLAFCMCSLSGGSAPVVTARTFSPSTPSSSGGTVGTATCSANCSGISWSITGGNSAGDFAINSSTGAITFTAQGQTDWNGASALQTASLTVQASNGATGSNTITVNGYADGSVNAPSATAQFPNALNKNAVLTINLTAGSGYTNGTGYAWTSSGCTSNATGTVDVVGGVLSNAVISTQGSGCSTGGGTTISVPAGAGAGTGGSLVPIVYAVRPAWKVAGVDYGVGVPTGSTLTDWQLISGAGITVDTTNREVTYSGVANPTINLVDFSLHSGAILVFTNCTGTISITNSNFGAGSTVPSAWNGLANINVDATSTVNLTITSNTINGGWPPNNPSATSSGSSEVRYFGGGTITAKYNYFTASPGNAISVGVGPSGSVNMTVDVEYNAFYNNGLNVTGQHANIFVPDFPTTSPGPIGTSWTMLFNFGWQPGGQTETTGSDAWQLEGDNSDNNSLHAATLAYTTIITGLSLGNYGASAVIHGNRDSLSPAATGSSTIHDNFLDGTGASSFTWYPNVYAGWTLSNNTNLVTGALYSNTQ